MESTPFQGSFALVFPGQGAQHVGMGKQLFEHSEIARDVYAKAREILGFDVSGMCFDGPEEELNRTFNTQPAVFVTSMAAYQTLKKHFEDLGHELAPSFVAGHSFGEFAAAVVAGAIDFADGLELVFNRARLMQQAQNDQPGGMISVIGLDNEAVKTVCETAPRGSEILTLAVENGPGHVVLSGDIPTVERAMGIVSKLGGKSVRLSIGVGAHSMLMKTAGDGFKAFVERVRVQQPEFPIVSNVTAQPLTTSDEVRRELMDQFTHPVLWATSVREMINDGVTSFVEVGPGQILSRLVRRIAHDVLSLSLNADPDEIARFLPSGGVTSIATKEAP